MITGTPIGRHCILVLRDGNIVIDWGSGDYQDVFTGKVLPVSQSSVSHAIREAELSWLKQTGLVSSYDEQQAQFTGLPGRPDKNLDQT